MLRMLLKTNHSMASSWTLTSKIMVGETVVDLYFFLLQLFESHLCFVYLLITGTPKVYTSFKETLSAIKSNKTARFKLFKSVTEAERFSVLGQEIPSTQIEKPTFNVSTSNNFKSLKSDDLVAFRRLIEGGEVEKVKSAITSNPRFLISSGDTPSILHVNN